MKILHLSSEYPPQQVFGLGRYVYDLAGAQAARGDEVHVVTNSMGGDLHEVIDREVRVHRVNTPPPPKPADDATTVMQFNAQLVERAVPVMRTWKPDVVHVHDWLTAAAGKIVAGLHGIPLVATIHDTVVGKRFGSLDNEHRFIARVERWLCERAHRIVCCGSVIRDELVETFGADPTRIRIIPCGVDASAFCPILTVTQRAAFRQMIAAPDETVVLYVGRLDAEKGLDVLMNALPGIRARHPRVRLAMVGKGALQASLQTWLQEHHLVDAVTWVGYVAPPALALVYAEADVLVMPSTYEPFGIVALEAMASGIPIVASATGGLTEIVDDGTTGRLVPPGNAEALAHAVNEVLGDVDARRRYGKAARERAVSQYNWHRIAELTVDVYAEVCHPAPTIAVPALPRQRPRVLFDCSPIHEGMTGIGRYADGLLGALPDAWPEAEWVLLGSPRNHAYLERTHGHRVIPGGEDCEFRFPTRAQSFGRIGREIAADVLFSPIFTAPEGAQATSVTMIHDLCFLAPGSLDPALREYTIAASAHAAENADAIVTVSECVRGQIMEHYRLDAERVHVASPGIDDCIDAVPSPSVRARVLRHYGIRGRYVLAVNLTNVRKNAKGLFDAFARLNNSGHVDVTLVVAGGWSLFGSNLWSLAHAYGIKNRVVLTGYVPRETLIALYASASAVCVPSLDEGFGMPIAEAMAMGIPVVTGNRGAMREVAGDAGILVEPEDPISIADGLARALAREPDLDARIAVGRHRSRAFTWASAAVQIAGVMRNRVAQGAMA